MKMLNLYLVHRNEKELYASVHNYQEACKKINNYCGDHGFKSRYTRLWTLEDGTIVFDFGSWSQFFHLEGYTRAEANKAIKGE